VSSRQIPDHAAVAVETGALRSRRRHVALRVRLARASLPYLLILPVLAAIGVVLGYPLYNLVKYTFLNIEARTGAAALTMIKEDGK